MMSADWSEVFLRAAICLEDECDQTVSELQSENQSCDNCGYNHKAECWCKKFRDQRSLIEEKRHRGEDVATQDLEELARLGTLMTTRRLARGFQVIVDSERGMVRIQHIDDDEVVHDSQGSSCGFRRSRYDNASDIDDTEDEESVTEDDEDMRSTNRVKLMKKSNGQLLELLRTMGGPNWRKRRVARRHIVDEILRMKRQRPVCAGGGYDSCAEYRSPSSVVDSHDSGNDVLDDDELEPSPDRPDVHAATSSTTGAAGRSGGTAYTREMLFEETYERLCDILIELGGADWRCRHRAKAMLVDAVLTQQNHPRPAPPAVTASAPPVKPAHASSPAASPPLVVATSTSAPSRSSLDRPSALVHKSRHELYALLVQVGGPDWRSSHRSRNDVLAAIRSFSSRSQRPSDSARTTATPRPKGRQTLDIKPLLHAKRPFRSSSPSTSTTPPYSAALPHRPLTLAS